jgi:hypothetical protein
MNEFIDGHENKGHFIIRLYDDPPAVWVYWPNMGKVEYYTDTLEQARVLFEALKVIKEPFRSWVI